MIGVLNILRKVEKMHLNCHRGWNDSIRLEEHSIKEIALSPSVNGDSDWKIHLEMHPGDTMNQAREFHRNVNIRRLLMLKENGWEIAPNMHFSFGATNLVWSSVGMSLEEYLAYWKKENAALNQVKRAGFSELFAQLEKLKLISNEGKEKLKTEFLDTKRQTMNICPGVTIKYKWSRLKATEFDNRKVFVKEVENHIDSALSTWRSKNVDN